MIETIDNTFQLAATGICAGISLFRGVRRKERAWALLGLFAGIFFLGDLYWLLFMVFFGDSPQFFTISDLSWYTSYLFLLLMLIYIGTDGPGNEEKKAKKNARRQLNRPRFYLWFIPAFTGGMCLFFIRWGDILQNIITAYLMAGVIWLAVSGLHDLHRQAAGMEREPSWMVGRRWIYRLSLIFCTFEYALWVSSCFWMGDGITNIYFWIDGLLSVTFLLFLPAMRKVVGR